PPPPRRPLRPRPGRGGRPDRRGPRTGRARGAAGPPGDGALGRHAPPPGDRPGPPARTRGAVPRRADDRPRPAEPRRGVGLRAVAPGPGGHDRAHDHPLHGRSRAVRPDRHRRPGRDRRPGHAGGAQGQRGGGPGDAAHRRRRRRGRRAAGPLRARGRRRRRGACGARRRRRGVRAPPVRRARRGHHLGDRGPSHARRRLPPLHGSLAARRRRRPRPGAEPHAGLLEGGPVTAAVAGTAVPARSWRSELRAARGVWRREVTRFLDDRLRIATALIQPVLFLFVLAPGLESLAERSTDGVALRTFMFPGVLCMAMWFSAMVSAASLVMDRELGFLRELAVAPVRRSSIVLGKGAGAVTAALVQGLILLALAGPAGVPYDPVLLAGLFGLQVLIAVAVTAFGIMVATVTS